MRNRPATLLLLSAALVLLLHLILLWKLHDQIAQGGPDFSAFYAAADMVAEGHGRQLFDLAEQFRFQQRFMTYPGRSSAIPFFHPPFETLLFVPFTWIAYTPAFWLWTALNLALIVATPLLLLRRDGPTRWGTWLLLLAIAAPVQQAVYQGQDVALSIAAVGGMVALLERRRDTTAGVVAALMLTRFYLLLPVVAALLAARRWRCLRALGLATLAAVGASVAVAGLDALWRYPQFLLEITRLPSSTSVNYPEMMSTLRGMLHVIVPDLSRELSLVLGLVGWGAASAAVYWWTRRRTGEITHWAAVSVLAALLFSPYSNAHDKALMLPIFALTQPWIPASGQSGGWLLACSALLYAVPQPERWSPVQFAAAALLLAFVLRAPNDRSSESAIQH